MAPSTAFASDPVSAVHSSVGDHSQLPTVTHYEKDSDKLVVLTLAIAKEWRSFMRAEHDYLAAVKTKPLDSYAAYAKLRELALRIQPLREQLMVIWADAEGEFYEHLLAQLDATADVLMYLPPK